MYCWLLIKISINQTRVAINFNDINYNTDLGKLELQMKSNSDTIFKMLL